MDKAIKDLFDFISNNFVEDRLSKSLGRWSTVIQFKLDKGKPFYFVVERGACRPQIGSHPKPSSTIGGTVNALIEVLKGAKDVTHFIANDEIRLICGNYFDMLNLSRAAAIIKR